MNIGQKINELLDLNGIKQKDLAQAVNISPSALSDFLNGKTKKLDIQKAKEISKALGCTLDYLLDDSCTSQKNNEFTFSPFEKEHIKKYRLIDAHGKEAVDAILNVEYKQYEAALLEKEKQAAAKSVKKAAPSYTPAQRHYPEGVIPLDSYHEEEYADKITLPIYDAGASAGTGVFLDSTYYETAAMPNTPLTQRANFAVWVEGDSMEPRFHNGDLVLVRTQPTVDIGEIGIFVVNGEGFIKKLGENKLISLNPDYDDIEFNEYDEIYCKGKVLGRV